MPFKCKLPNPEPIPHHLLYWALTLRATTPLNYASQGQVPGNWRQPHAQSPLKLFIQPILRLLAASPTPPMETTIKTLACVFPSLPLPPDQPWCFPMCPPPAPPQWHGMSPPLGFCEYNELSFQWQLSPGLLASLYLNNNKTYILKQTPPVSSITQEQNPGFFPQLRRASMIWALPALKTLSPAPLPGHCAPDSAKPFPP